MDMARMRLDRFFSSQRLLTRREIRPLLRAGLIQVNGVPASSPEQPIDPERDQIALKNEPVDWKPHRYLMLHKPQGVVSSTGDPHSRTVLDLVPPAPWKDGLFPAGRLDKDSTGFVLLTNDGEFAHAILSPRHHVDKTYEVGLDGPLTAENRCRLEAGVTLADGSVCRGMQLRLLRDDPDPVWEVILSEGKYHQIKRMFGVVGLGVNTLKRTAIGGLRLDEMLPEGACREISDKEVDEILGK